MWTPGQSGTCSPVAYVNEPVLNNGGNNNNSSNNNNVNNDEFAFGSSSNDNSNGNNNMVAVNAWEGEMIHEECGSDELELTLGISSARAAS